MHVLQTWLNTLYTSNSPGQAAELERKLTETSLLKNHFLSGDFQQHCSTHNNLKVMHDENMQCHESAQYWRSFIIMLKELCSYIGAKVKWMLTNFVGVEMAMPIRHDTTGI